MTTPSTQPIVPTLDQILAPGPVLSKAHAPLPARVALGAIALAAASALGYHGYNTFKDKKKEEEEAKAHGAKKAASFGLSPEDLLPSGPSSEELGRAAALRALGF